MTINKENAYNSPQDNTWSEKLWSDKNSVVYYTDSRSNLSGSLRENCKLKYWCLMKYTRVR